MGRRRAIIDWDLVSELFEADCTIEGVAATIGVHRDVLYKRCPIDQKTDLSTFKQQKKASGDELLRKKQFNTAMSDKPGSITMQIWLGKQRLGQSDKSEVQNTGTVNINHTGEIAFAQAAAKIYGLDTAEVKGYLDSADHIS